MSPLPLALIGALALAASGVLAVGLVRAPRIGVLVSTTGAVAGALLGGGAALWALLDGRGFELMAPWSVPGGALVVGIDALSAFFLVPLFTLTGLGAVYGRSYLGARALPAAAFNLLCASMALVLLARHALVFLVSWEAMTLLAYLLVSLDHAQAEARRAGWVYLIASHVAVIALFALFVLLGARAGGALEFDRIARAWQAPEAPVAAVLGLALFGFGIKAGVLGLHVWLPEAHAAAPSHVSALMSGVLVKLGLYGLLRVTLWVPPAPWFGSVLMLLGVGGGLLGITLALQQRDLKRALAYSSVENVGIILLGLGLGFWARSRGDGLLAATAFAGGLLHVWNHTLMKGLLFFGAGSLLHATGTRDLERLGGLLPRLPWTGSAVFLGAVAIAGLPPLNGFTGEWLLYRALAQVGVNGAAPANLAATGAAASLALIGGLAALAFVRLVGIALLGTPRSEDAAAAYESPRAMTLPMLALAVACVAASVAAPGLVALQAHLLEALALASRAEVLGASSGLVPLAALNAALLVALSLVGAGLLRRARGALRTETWGCGFVLPTPRMQYTGRAFVELVTARAFPRWFRAPLRERAPRGVFPESASFESDASDPLTRGAYEPLLTSAGDRFARLRFLQQGNTNIYLLYIFATAIAALAWVAIRNGALR